MLEVSHISHFFGKTQPLHDVSFTVNESELLCLVGASGCGKSTLLRLIAGLETVQNGAVHFNGDIIADANTHTPAHLRNIGLVFQHPSLFPHLTVAQNICFGLRHLAAPCQKDVCAEMLRLVGLQSRGEAYPHQLSGGQHQRVALARSLAPNPKIMLLDEPFANLDHVLRRDIREEVIAILKAANIPIIMVTHDPEEALIMADTMVLLGGNGTIKQKGSPDSIHNAPIDIDAARFFGHINEVKGCISRGVIKSELGDLDASRYAPHLPEGKVTIATRPEGIRIAITDEAYVNAVVEHVNHTGAGWLVRARLSEGDVIRFHHIYGTRPRIDDMICVTYEPPHIFVFER